MAAQETLPLVGELTASSFALYEGLGRPMVLLFLELEPAEPERGEGADAQSQTQTQTQTLQGGQWGKRKSGGYGGLAALPCPVLPCPVLP